MAPKKKEKDTCNPVMKKVSQQRIKVLAALAGISMVEFFDLISCLPVDTIKKLVKETK